MLNQINSNRNREDKQRYVEGEKEIHCWESVRAFSLLWLQAFVWFIQLETEMKCAANTTISMKWFLCMTLSKRIEIIVKMHVLTCWNVEFFSFYRLFALSFCWANIFFLFFDVNADKIVVNVECNQKLQTQNLQMISSESLNKLRSSTYTIYLYLSYAFNLFTALQFWWLTNPNAIMNQKTNKKIQIFVIRSK